MTAGALRRAFVAVALPDDVREALVARVGHARGADDGLRWTPSTQWHVTLRFLGRVGDAGALLDAVRGVGERCAPFRVALGGIGAFPSLRRGTVVWAGVTEGAEALRGLAAELSAPTTGLGEPDERGPFRPHVTLARARRPRDLHAVASALGGAGFGGAGFGAGGTVDEMVVFESDTRRDGAVHHVVGRAALAAARPSP